MRRAQGALATLFACFLLASSLPSAACVGPPPEPVCGKNLTLALAGPSTVVLTGGGTHDVSALIYLALLDFPEGLGACAVGPYTTSVLVTADCTPGPDGGGQVLNTFIGAGFTNITVPVSIPAGPARQCTLQATAAVGMVDGMILTETADNVLCVVDPAVGAPSIPRLDLELLGPSGSDVVRTHPGDQAAFTYRITNNDPTEMFVGDLTADMLNEARMPEMSGPQPPGTGVFSISDPVQGDNFALVFEDGLFNGSVPLSPDPLAPEIPSISQFITLDPGEATEITLYTRHWGMCADGSCGRSTVTVDGAFSDLSSGVACTGFVLAADTSMPPAYGSPDAGEVAEFPEPDDPSMPELELGGDPSPGLSVELLIKILKATLRADGQSIAAPLVTADRLDSERGRIQLQFLGNFPADVEIDFDGEVLAQHISPTDTVETERVSLLDGPTGFLSEVPSAEVLTRITDTLTDNISFFDLTYQVTFTGIDISGARRPFTFDDLKIVRRADGSGWDVVLRGGQSGEPSDDPLEAIELLLDLRGFISPAVQASMIFEDGFESGNVSRWSNSEP